MSVGQSASWEFQRELGILLLGWLAPRRAMLDLIKVMSTELVCREQLVVHLPTPLLG